MSDRINSDVSGVLSTLPPLYTLPAFFTLSEEDEASYASAFLEYLKAVLKSRDERIYFVDWIAFEIFEYYHRLKGLTGVNKGTLKTVFLEFLSSEDERVRSDAWGEVDSLLDEGIITKEEAVERKGSFLELFKFEDELVRGKAWIIAGTLFKLGIIDKDEIINRKFYLFKMNFSKVCEFAKELEETVDRLTTKHVFTEEEEMYIKEQLKKECLIFP